MKKMANCLTNKTKSNFMMTAKSHKVQRWQIAKSY